MENMPLISVVTTVYNTEKYVEKCFESIINQSYKNIELIIVNNASQGNIKEIIKKYKVVYPDFNIKEIDLENNIGLFHGRLAGASIATGSYISFIDSDDYISIDYYRLLIEKAINDNADMVATDFVYVDENNKMTLDIYNGLISNDFIYLNDQIKDIYFQEAATSFYWNLIWNKLYSIELWNKCVPFFEKNKNQIVMCDDIAFTVVLYANAQKFVNIHNPKYYYLRRSDANSVFDNDYKRAKSIINDIINVFDFFENFVLENCKIYLKEVDTWKERYYRIWKNAISRSSLSIINKKLIINDLKKGLKVINENNNLEISQDWIFTSTKGSFNNGLEEIKQKIADKKIKYVSFDIFDTLILRNLWEPYDLFKFLNIKFNKIIQSQTFIDFAAIRSYCESQAMLKLKREVTLDDIYNEIMNSYCYPKDIINTIKNYEIELELEFTLKRKTGYELFQFAKHLNKKIICISDMYLSKDVIQKILINSGYDEDVEIYVSSEIGCSKNSGELFKYVLKKLKIKGFEIVHIGDNYNTDYTNSINNGYNACYLPKALNMFCDCVPELPVGKLFFNAFINKNNQTHNNTIFSNIGTRTMMALLINKYYDNPFVPYISDSEFHSDPYFIGYFCLGFYLFSICTWIKKLNNEKKYEKINFVSRDGYLLKKAFNIMYPNINTDYVYLSRDALLSVFFNNKNDLIGFSHLVYEKNYSPETLIDIFENSISIDKKRISEILKQHKICNTCFSSKEKLDVFLQILGDEIIDFNKHKLFKEEMKKAFSKIIQYNNCTVDIGYSGRPEGILTNLLNYKVDALYLFNRKEKTSLNQLINNFNIFPHQDYYPNITHEILLELLISDTNNSCKKLKIENGNLIPIFKNNKQNFATCYFINIMQEAAIDFIKEFTTLYNKWGDFLSFSNYDLVFPLDYYLKKAPDIDFNFLSSAFFDDNFNLANQPNLQQIRAWDLKIPPSECPNKTLAPIWLHALYLFFTNRDLFIKKSCNYFRNKPLRYKFLRKAYRCLKKIKG